MHEQHIFNCAAAGSLAMLQQMLSRCLGMMNPPGKHHSESFAFSILGIPPTRSLNINSSYFESANYADGSGHSGTSTSLIPHSRALYAPTPDIHLAPCPRCKALVQFIDLLQESLSKCLSMPIVCFFCSKSTLQDSLVQASDCDK
jgi:hypothetical protein